MAINKLKTTQILKLLNLIAISIFLIAINPDISLAEGKIIKKHKAPKLKEHVTVYTDYVTIGDLLEYNGLNKDVPVFRSPDLGKTGRVMTSRIALAALRAGIDKIETGNISYITVSRASRTISEDVITSSITKSLSENISKEQDNIKISFDKNIQGINVEFDSSAPLEVKKINVSNNKRFTAFLTVDDSKNFSNRPIAITGSFINMIDVYQLKDTVLKNETISQQKIKKIKIEEHKFKSNMVRDIDVLQGLVANRNLGAKTILNIDDFSERMLVEEKKPVLIVYQTKGVKLTLKGKALKSGAKGDIIQVKNLQSERTIDAVVAGEGLVSVTDLAVTDNSGLLTSTRRF